MATLYLDYEGGNDGNDGLSFANRKKNLDSAYNGASAGDVVRVMASETPTSIGSATWTNNSPTVTLSASRTTELYSDGAWTASTNVTAVASTTRREGANSSQLTIASGFTTGLVAYYALPGVTDLSSKQKVSFWVQTTTDTSDLSIFSLRLCSDTAGVTTVDTIQMPAHAMEASEWTCVTVDTGGALGSSIQSIALYADSDPGAVVIRLDNIFATNDLSLNGVISKNGNGSGDGTVNNIQWWHIRSVVGDTITLDEGDLGGATVPEGYWGVSESTTTEFFTPVEFPTIIGSTTDDIYFLTADGTDGSPITISGGWSRVDMASQVGITGWSVPNSMRELIVLSAVLNFTMEKMFLGRCYRGFYAGGVCDNITITDCGFAGAGIVCLTIVPSSSAGLGYTLANVYANQSGTVGISLSNLKKASLTGITATGNGADGINIISCNASSFTNIQAFSNGSNGCQFQTSDSARVFDMYMESNTVDNLFLSESSNCIFYDLVCKNSSQAGISFDSSANNVFYNPITSGNTAGSLEFITPSSGENYMYNASFSEATELSVAVDYENTRVISIDHDQTADNHIIFTDGGQINSNSTTRHTASGISWEFKPTSATRDVDYPLQMRISAIAVAAGSLVTAKIWVRRTHIGTTGSFLIRKSSLVGIATEQVASISAAADTWEQLTITFTPTRAGVAEFIVEAYGGTSESVYFDDFDVTQA